MVKKNIKHGGFTLVELLVVIAIIGLLSTLSLVALNNARQRSRDAARVADIRQIQTALELYYNDNNTYPGYGAAAGFTFGGTLSTTTGIYMSPVPNNPTPWADGVCTLNFAYTRDNTASYHIVYCLAGATAGISSGLHTATPSGIANP